MKKLLVTLLLVSAVVVLAFGKWHYDNKIEKDGLRAAEAFEKDKQEELQKEKEKIASLEKSQFNSVLDWLKYKSTQKQQINISVLGSSVTQGAGASVPEKKWSELLSSFLNKQEGISTISLKNSGFGGYTTQQLISENKINEVLTNRPDLVIIEPTLINNYALNVSIKQTEEDVLYFMNEIKKNLPETLIIIQSSNPTDPAEFDVENKLGNNYVDYVKSLETFSKENSLNYFNIYSGIVSLQQENNKKLEDILSDDRHPNDLGYEYWYETLKTSFEKVPLIK